MEKRAELLNLMSQARMDGALGVEILRLHRSVLEQSDSRGKAVRREEPLWHVSLWKEGSHGRGSAATKEQALALAMEDSRPSDALSGPAEKMMIRAAGTGIDDRRHEGIGDPDRAEVLHLAERALTGLPIRCQMLYRQERTWRSFVNSRGVEAEEFATTYELYAELTVEGRKLYHRIASRRFSDIASLPFGTELRRRVDPLLRRLPAVPTLPVVLEPRVVASLFRTLAPAFAADAIANGSSFLKDHLGKAIGSPIFHLTDDAGMVGGLYTTAFDDRGVPPIPVTLLKEGVVTGLYHDPESARAAGLRPTGHCRDGQLQPSNLILRPGARTRNVTLGELGNYLLLDQSPPMDLRTGELSGPLDLVVVERGEKKGSIRQDFRAPITKVLRAIQEVVSDQERSCEVDAPTAIFVPGFGA
jgi:predicted Zn-dependent protease